MSDDSMKAAMADYAADQHNKYMRRPDHFPAWMGWFNGRPYRVLMRLMHRWGWCYPTRNAIGDGSVWCHWCGMRGKA